MLIQYLLTDFHQPAVRLWTNSTVLLLLHGPPSSNCKHSAESLLVLLDIIAVVQGSAACLVAPHKTIPHTTVTTQTSHYQHQRKLQKKKPFNCNSRSDPHEVTCITKYLTDLYLTSTNCAKKIQWICCPLCSRP